MKKLLSFILSITILFSIVTSAFAEEVSAPAQKAVLTVGINAEYFPFEYYEGEELKGFDIDLMNYIGERIGYDIDYVEFPFDRLIPAVASGEVDCAISAISVTTERDGVVDYTVPYLEADVTYSDGETALERYAVVFSENSVNKARLIEASGDPFLSEYMLVDKAIRELTADSTVDKLIEKYELEKVNISDIADYKFNTFEETEKAETADKNIPKYESWEEIGLKNPHPSDWAKENIVKAQDLGITEKGKIYSYKNPITREEFCELIYNYCYNVIKEVDTVTEENTFTDTTNSKIIRLNAMGIINGKTKTQFAPDDLLTREEAAVILNRMVNKTIPVPVTEKYFNFDDEKNISDWAMDAVQTICNMNVMNGVGNNNFSPKESYTTEQAIVTIVRVYAAQTANIKNIGEADKQEEITVTETIKLDDFYVDEAIKLITESGKLAADKDFISLYTTNDEMTEKILVLGSVDFNKPADIYCLSADREQITANIEALAKAEGVDIKDLGEHWFEHIWRKLNFSTLASLINSSYGAENLAALTILTNSRGYIMPKDFKDDFALFIQYEGDYSAIISFSEFGDGIISANMSFVINGDKDNVFRRLYEINSAVGEDGVKIAKVEK